MSGIARSSMPSRSAHRARSSISPRCSSRWRSAASCSAWPRSMRGWRFSADGAPGSPTALWCAGSPTAAPTTSNSVVTRWLTNGRYYQLNLVSGDHKNPEYRIAEDLRVATDSPVDFMAGVTSALLSAATFIVVLWTIGGALTITLGGTTLTIPGFLVIAAVLYAAIASGSILVIGRRFVQISEDKNQAEADFRYTLTRVRENGESIALLGGEEEERGGIDRNFTNVLRQWARLAGQHMRTTLVSQGSSLVAPVVPLLLCAPKFLDGSMTLGQVMQAASAFTIVQTAFGWLVDNYPRLADWNACARRIA